MIKLLKDYFDKNGHRYKVLSFGGDKYACQSYRSGKCVYLGANELFTSPPAKPSKTGFTDMVIKNEEPEPQNIPEPIYEEPVYDFQQTELKNQKPILLKDNIEETAEDDFYADF